MPSDWHQVTTASPVALIATCAPVASRPGADTSTGSENAPPAWRAATCTRTCSPSERSHVASALPSALAATVAPYADRSGADTSTGTPNPSDADAPAAAAAGQASVIAQSTAQRPPVAAAVRGRADGSRSACIADERTGRRRAGRAYLATRATTSRYSTSYSVRPSGPARSAPRREVEEVAVERRRRSRASEAA